MNTSRVNRGRLTRRTQIVFALMIAVLLGATVAGAAVRTDRYRQVAAQAGGLFAVYDYNGGTSVARDVAADWDSGVYANTTKTPDGNSVVLKRRGDVAPDPANPWWDATWRTRRCWTVTNPTAAPVTNSRATLTFDTTADIANGWMQPTGADIRALTGGLAPSALSFSAPTPLPSVSSAVIVEVPSLGASASLVVCLYWGNPSATAASVVLTSVPPVLYRLASGIGVADPTGNWSNDAAPLPSGITTTLSPTTNTAPPGAVTHSAAWPQFSQTAPAVPVGTPPAIFTNASKVTNAGGGNFFQWNFAVPTGTPVEVRVFASEPETALSTPPFLERNFIATAIGTTTAFVWNNEGPAKVCTTATPALDYACGVMKSAFVTSAGGTVGVQFKVGTAGPAGGVRRAIWSAIEVRSVGAVALTTAGGTNREGFLEASGTWTSIVTDAGSAAAVYGLVSPLVNGANLAIGLAITSNALPTIAIAAGNDGRRDGTPFLSTTVSQPYWDVDLGSVQPISRVNVFTTPYAMNDVTVFVSPTPLTSYTSPGAVPAAIPRQPFAGAIASNNMDSVFPAGTTGRYVRIWAAGTGSLNLAEVEVLSNPPSGVSVQVAVADVATGPWNFVGPDGTAATSYNSTLPFPYSFDNHRYYRVQATLASPSGVASPYVDKISTNAALPALPRSAEDAHLFTAPNVGLNWLVRIKTPLTNIASTAKAVLVPENSATWGTSQVSGYLDRSAVSCCVANSPFFSTAGAATSQTAVALYDVGGFRNLSVALDRVNNIAASFSQVVDIALSPTFRVQVPLRSSASAVSNLATSGVASQSSTGFGGIASRANDGNTDGQYFTGSSVMHTNFEAQPWWQVDFGSSRVVNEVQVFNRLDCCNDRLTAFYIVVSQNPLPATFTPGALTAPGVTYQAYTGGPFSTPQVLTFPGGAVGRYVRLWSQNTNYLHVAEVRVLGP